MPVPSSNPPRFGPFGWVVITIILGSAVVGCCIYKGRQLTPRPETGHTAPNPNVHETVTTETTEPNPTDPDPSGGTTPPEIADTPDSDPGNDQAPPPAPPVTDTPPAQPPVVFPPPAVPVTVTNYVTQFVTNYVTAWKTNFVRVPGKTVTVTNRVTTTRTELINAEAAKSGGPIVIFPQQSLQQAAGAVININGRDGFVGWHPGMAGTNGLQQVIPNGAVPGTAGYFQMVKPDQKGFALNTGQIAVIDFPSGIGSWKLLLPPTEAGNARVLFDGLTVDEKNQAGGIASTQRVTVQNTGKELLFAQMTH